MEQRTILFRGKLCHSERWIVGNLIIAQNGQPYIIPNNVFEPDGHHLIIDSDNPFWVILETVGQFTGLTDKNGVKVFEGDILGWSSKIIGHVIGGVRGYCYDVIYKNPLDNGELDWSLYATITDDYKGRAEVIGSIHDNPELLTK